MTAYNINIAKGATELAVDWANMPEASKLYIIRYGLTQSLNDAHASIKSTDVEAEQKARNAAEQRLKDLMEGNPPSVGARAQSKPEWYTVAEDMLKKALRANGIKPKAVEDLDGAVRKLYEVKQAEIDAEVLRRKDAASVDLKALGL